MGAEANKEGGGKLSPSDSGGRRPGCPQAAALARFRLLPRLSARSGYPSPWAKVGQVLGPGTRRWLAPELPLELRPVSSPPPSFSGPVFLPPPQRRRRPRPQSPCAPLATAQWNCVSSHGSRIFFLCLPHSDEGLPRSAGD